MDAGGKARLALASTENRIRDVSFYELYSKYIGRGSAAHQECCAGPLGCSPIAGRDD